MIDVSDDDVAAERRASDGRFVLFVRGDDATGSTLIPWWGVVLDILGDGHSILVRLDERAASEGWTALDLLDVALARVRAQRKHEERQGTTSPSSELVRHLLAALYSERQRRGMLPRVSRVGFTPGYEGSPYPWTMAVLESGPELPLCPDPGERESGITLEQLLIVLDQLFADVLLAIPRDGRLRRGLDHIRAALGLETQRTASLRATR